MWEVRETSPTKDLRHGHTIAGLVAVPLTVGPLDLVRGVLIRAAGPNDLVPNTDVVYIGRAGVTADSDPGTGGMPLVPGAVIELPINDPSLIYAVSLSDGQDIAWMGV